MRRGTAFAAIAGVFLLGLLTGAAATHLFYLRTFGQPGRLAELGLRVVARDLDRRLDLTDSQREQVDLVLAETRQELEAVRIRTGPEVAAIFERAEDRIAAGLTPEQRRELDRLRRERAGPMGRLLESLRKGSGGR